MKLKDVSSRDDDRQLIADIWIEDLMSYESKLKAAKSVYPRQWLALEQGATDQLSHFSKVLEPDDVEKEAEARDYIRHYLNSIPTMSLPLNGSQAEAMLTCLEFMEKKTQNRVDKLSKGEVPGEQEKITLLENIRQNINNLKSIMK